MKHSLLILAFLFVFTVANGAGDLRREYILEKIKCDTIPPSSRISYIHTLDDYYPELKDSFLTEKGMAYIAAGRFAEATETFRTLTQLRDIPLDSVLNARYWCAWSSIAQGRYESALEEIFTLMTTPVPDSLSYYPVEADFLTANIYIKLGNPKEAHKYLDAVEEKIERAAYPQKYIDNHRYRLLIERASVLMKEGKYEEALLEDRKALSLSPKQADTNVIYMDFSEIYDKLGMPDIAEEYFLKANEARFSDPGYNVNTEYSLANYAMFLVKHKRYSEAIKIIDGQLSRTYITDMAHVRAALLDKKAQACAATGHEKEAYALLRQSVELMDSLNESPSQDGFSQTITRDFENRVAELSRQSLANTNRTHRMIIVWLGIALGIIGVAVTWVWIVNRRHHSNDVKIRDDMARQSNELAIHAQKISCELSEASREIVSTSLRLAETRAVLNKVAEISGNAKTPPAEILRQIRTLLKDVNLEDKAWTTFRLHFEGTYPGFMEKLMTCHPNLTPGEQKMAAFVVMDLSQREIAGLLCRSERTVETTRYRLRKKLGLEATTSLSTYLKSLLKE